MQNWRDDIVQREEVYVDSRSNCQDVQVSLTFATARFLRRAVLRNQECAKNDGAGVAVTSVRLGMLET